MLPPKLVEPNGFTRRKTSLPVKGGSNLFFVTKDVPVPNAEIMLALCSDYYTNFVDLFNEAIF